MAQPLTDAIEALTTYANTVTGASDTTLSDAVATLAAGYRGKSRLPSEYQEVDFVGVWTNCYFNLGVLSSTNPGYYFSGQFLSRNGTGGPHIISTDNNYLVFAPRSANTLVKLCGNESTSAAGLPAGNVIAELNKNSDGYFEMAKSNGTTSATLTKGSLTSGTVYLCAYGMGLTQTQYHYNGFVYEVKLYDDGTIVNYFVPCYRKADDVIGFYDMINDSFITNIGSGNLSKGSDVYKG